MTPTEMICSQVVMGACEVLFLAGVAWVWRELMRMRVNGACQMGLALLVLVRLSAAASGAIGPAARALDWMWLTEALFSFVFLYTLYHMGVLISACRR